MFVFKSNQIHICQTTIVEKKTLTSILRQNEQHEQIEIMANHGPFCKRIKMIKKLSSNQLCGRDSECKMVRFQSPPVYILDSIKTVILFKEEYRPVSYE